MTGVILGVALAVAAVVLVALPFLREPAPADDRLDAPTEEQERRLALVEERDRTLAALKELEFDHRTGKISDDDYHALVGPLRRSAAAALRDLDRTQQRLDAQAPRSVVAVGAVRETLYRSEVHAAESLQASAPEPDHVIQAKRREMSALDPMSIEAPMPVPVPEPGPPPDEGTPPRPTPVPEAYPPPDEATPPMPDPVPEPGPQE